MPHALSPIHPGEILREEFLQPLGITQYRLAKETSVPPRRINEIVLEQRGITADTALRLAKFFGTSEMFWLNLQAQYDLDIQRQKLGSALGQVRPFTSRGVGGLYNAKIRDSNRSLKRRSRSDARDKKVK
jgi:addiction module HigA family antidote